MLLTVDKGRPWSVIEHVILEALAEKAWTTAELAVAGKLPRRIVIEACARLMRAGIIPESTCEACNDLWGRAAA